MILPIEKGTSDSCVAFNEGGIFYCQDEYNLIALVCIHNHPDMPAFLSSVDLYTHYSQQLLIPESITVVQAKFLILPGIIDYTT